MKPAISKDKASSWARRTKKMDVHYWFYLITWEFPRDEENVFKHYK